MQWQPSAKLEILQQRSQLIQQIRQFFYDRGVLEVETPLMCHTSVTDPFIESIPALFKAHPNSPHETYYLQTSPEYAMKRLLAAGSGPIYQISKAFRQEEVGRLHNPEFTMLEWYRPGFDHHQLMKEVDELLQLILQTPPSLKRTYAELFMQYLGINPHDVSITALIDCAKQHEIELGSDIADKDTWLNLLMTHCIEPQLGRDKPCFIYDFPASQASLSRIQATNPPVASRFEVYYHGMELANGFHELLDANEQRLRFEKNVAERKGKGLTAMHIDEYLLHALQFGLPDCAGVALGIDRLIMLATNQPDIAKVLSFDFARICHIK